MEKKVPVPSKEKVLRASGKIFARTCPGCGTMHQTADQSGKTPCDSCADKMKAEEEAAAKKKGGTKADESAPEPTPEPTTDTETIGGKRNRFR